MRATSIGAASRLPRFYERGPIEARNEWWKQGGHSPGFRASMSAAPLKQ